MKLQRKYKGEKSMAIAFFFFSSSYFFLIYQKLSSLQIYSCISCTPCVSGSHEESQKSSGLFSRVYSSQTTRSVEVSAKGCRGSSANGTSVCHQLAFGYRTLHATA